MILGTPDRQRLTAVDGLRGLVMVIMALDHTRDFFHISAASFPPEDLTQSTPALFFTRWITHFCAPVFMFVAGMGAYFWKRRHDNPSGLSRFLWTRGLWLVVLELTVMRVAYNFDLSARYPVLLLVLWALGSCMIILSALVYLPLRWLAVLSVAVIVLHNTLDGVTGGALWNIVHQPGVFRVAGILVVVGYPLVPWFAVMGAGFCFGQVFFMDPAARQRVLLRLGAALTLAFIVIRGVNHYGNPVPWSGQKEPVFTVLSFLNCTKYPPSLDFLLMTLGPAMLVLAWLDKLRLRSSNPLVVLGRVPLFYFIVHFYAIHALWALFSVARYGRAALSFVFNPPPSMGAAKELFPSSFGYELWTVYIIWIVVVVSLYPLCRWFAGVKARRRDWWLGYL